MIVVLILAQHVYLCTWARGAHIWAAIKMIPFGKSENIQGFILYDFLKKAQPAKSAFAEKFDLDLKFLPFKLFFKKIRVLVIFL